MTKQKIDLKVNIDIVFLK